MGDDQSRIKRRKENGGKALPEKQVNIFSLRALSMDFNMGSENIICICGLYILVRILQYYTEYNITKKIYNYIHYKYDDQIVLFQVSEHFILELMASLKIQHLTN